MSLTNFAFNLLHLYAEIPYAPVRFVVAMSAFITAMALCVLALGIARFVIQFVFNFKCPNCSCAHCSAQIQETEQHATALIKVVRY